MALQQFFHQCSGFCSAQPSFREVIDCSLEGSEIRSIGFPVEISVIAALINEVPISRPRLYILFSKIHQNSYNNYNQKH